MGCLGAGENLMSPKFVVGLVKSIEHISKEIRGDEILTKRNIKENPVFQLLNDCKQRRCHPSSMPKGNSDKKK